MDGITCRLEAVFLPICVTRGMALDSIILRKTPSADISTNSLL